MKYWTLKIASKTPTVKRVELTEQLLPPEVRYFGAFALAAELRQTLTHV